MKPQKSWNNCKGNQEQQTPQKRKGIVDSNPDFLVQSKKAVELGMAAKTWPTLHKCRWTESHKFIW